jgi:hypothetical protein
MNIYVSKNTTKTTENRRILAGLSFRGIFAII